MKNKNLKRFNICFDSSRILHEQKLEKSFFFCYFVIKAKKLNKSHVIIFASAIFGCSLLLVGICN